MHDSLLFLVLVALSLSHTMEYYYINSSKDSNHSDKKSTNVLLIKKETGILRMFALEVTYNSTSSTVISAHAPLS